MSSKAEAFARLAKSKFRSRFRLDDADCAYIARVGMETVRRHAEDFVRTKLAPAEPGKDGRQTPMRGHPVFKAMHGSAMCCRGCMEKWWKVPRHRPLSPDQQRKAVDFLMEWIARRNMNIGGISEGNIGGTDPSGGVARQTQCGKNGTGVCVNSGSLKAETGSAS